MESRGVGSGDGDERASGSAANLLRDRHVGLPGKSPNDLAHLLIETNCEYQNIEEACI